MGQDAPAGLRGPATRPTRTRAYLQVAFLPRAERNLDSGPAFGSAITPRITYPREVAEADSALVRAWRLALEDASDEVECEFESLLPTLIAAGYAEADEFTWHFTSEGAARAERLVSDDA